MVKAHHAIGRPRRQLLPDSSLHIVESLGIRGTIGHALAEIALSIRTDVEFDYVHATRYRGATSGSELHWLREPAVDLTDRTVLLVDDILDEGHTLKAVRDDCMRRGARRVLVVSLCTKQHDRLVDGIKADFNGVELPDRYVFGFGMDYHEQGRNLPGIYALK